LTSAKKVTSAANKPYHHGNLRDALIIAAAELIEENASVEFTMIDAARRAGVSSAAPYRHFKDKDALLQEVGLLGFLALTEFVQEETKNFSPGTEEGIIAIGRGYVEFVTNHPQFYDLMWGDMGLRGLDFADQEVKTSGFHDLVESVGQWCDKMNLSHYNALELSVKLLAMAHGLACLAMNHHLEKFLPEVDVNALLESSTHTFLEGLRRETLD
jgi:AcrR family transcriptional regulator